jgi:hypothetical protein
MTRKLFCSLAIFVSLFAVILSPQQILSIRAEEKQGYLILVLADYQKEQYSNYIEERQDRFNIQIFSLQEHKKTNKQENVKILMIDIFQSLRFVHCVLDEKITKSLVKKTGSDGRVWEYYSDFYYSDLDNDGKADLNLSRMSAVMAENKKVKSNKNKVTEGMTYSYYIHTTYCSDISCAIGPTDPSISGNKIAKSSSDKGIEAMTLYETRSCVQPKYKPTETLNKENFVKHLQNSTIVITNTTSEPWNAYKKWEATKYNTAVTSIWEDKDKNGKVDDTGRSEIEIEEFYSFEEEITNRKIGFFGLSQIEKNVVNYLKENYYNFVLIGDGYFVYSPETLEMVMAKLFDGQTLSFSCWSSNYNYLSAVDFPIEWEIWGPPETTIIDLINIPKLSLKSIEPNEPIDIEIDLGYSKERGFSIENIGVGELTWSFTKIPDWISIEPSSGINNANIRIDIVIKIKEKELINYCTLPKEKYGFLTLKTNDPNRKEINIKVKAKGIFNGNLRGDS